MNMMSAVNSPAPFADEKQSYTVTTAQHANEIKYQQYSIIKITVNSVWQTSMTCTACDIKLLNSDNDQYQILYPTFLEWHKNTLITK